MVKLKFEVKLDLLLLLVGGVYVSCRPLQLRKPVLVSAANQSRGYLLASALRGTAGKARGWCVAALNGELCPLVSQQTPEALC